MTESSRRSRARGLMPAVAAASAISAVVAGVGTGAFALWADAATPPPVQIESGSLELALEGPMAFAVEGQSIPEPAARPMTQGETGTITQALIVSGDSDAGALQVAWPKTGTSRMAATYTVSNSEGETVIASTPVGQGTATPVSVPPGRYEFTITYREPVLPHSVNRYVDTTDGVKVDETDVSMGTARIELGQEQS